MQLSHKEQQLQASRAPPARWVTVKEAGAVHHLQRGGGKVDGPGDAGQKLKLQLLAFQYAKLVRRLPPSPQNKTDAAKSLALTGSLASTLKKSWGVWIKAALLLGTHCAHSSCLPPLPPSLFASSLPPSEAAQAA